MGIIGCNRNGEERIDLNLEVFMEFCIFVDD